MKPVVLDCSVAMAWCFQDEQSPSADAVLDHLRQSEAFVPSLWQFEVANALLAGERRGRLDQSRSMRFITLLGSLPITVDEETHRRAFREVLSLARAHDLSAYDAAYLELALRRGLPLATLDEKLKSAARHVGAAVV